jgi:hypothetical protein
VQSTSTTSINPITPATTSAPIISPNDVLQNITNEAGIINSDNLQNLLANSGVTADTDKEQASLIKYKAILNLDSKIGAEQKTAINDFIVYGTPSTKILGAGERAGVVNSYFQAFGNLPASAAQWSDVIKIANGRWPGQDSPEALRIAQTSFKAIYLRSADMKNASDNAAVTVMAYGLRPSARNLNSEKAAIKIYRAIFNHNPSTARAWDAVRAIAYSGAKR